MDEFRMTAVLRESLEYVRRNVKFGFCIFEEDFAEVYNLIEKRYRELAGAERERKRAEGKR